MIPCRRNAPRGLRPDALRERWVENAKKLDLAGRFARYPERQRAEVLNKGYLGRWRPDQALAVAKREFQCGRAVRTGKFIDEMRNCWGMVEHEEIRDTVLKILDEVPPESYEPPSELREPAGTPFVFHSRTLRAQVFFKFQIGGTTGKPHVVFWSCHPPVYR